jgi:hypothetical protein
MRRNRRRKPHSPTRFRSKGIALVMARQALATVHRQLPTMPLPKGSNRVEVILEYERIMSAMEARLRRITGTPKGEKAPE